MSDQRVSSSTRKAARVTSGAPRSSLAVVRGAADVQTVQDLAKLLRQLRRREARQQGETRLTYRQLAAKTGWSRGVIGEYFAGNILPPTERFDILIRLLGATAAEQGALATARDRAEERRRHTNSDDAPTERVPTERAPAAAARTGTNRTRAGAAAVRLPVPRQLPPRCPGSSAGPRSSPNSTPAGLTPERRSPRS